MAPIVVVAGSRGQLGREVFAAFARLGSTVHALSRDQLDVSSRAACHEAMRELQPDVVIDCARPTSRANGGAEIAATRVGAENVALAARKIGSYSAYISCGEVFGACGERPYAEDDEPHPSTSAGWAKLEAERAALDANPRGAVVRTAWLFGIAGPNFAENLLEAARVGEEVEVDATAIGNPTFTGHLAEALFELIRARRHGIYHLAGAGACTRSAFAEVLLREAGLNARIVPREADEAHPSTGRALVSSRPAAIRLPSWRAGVTGYLSAMGESGLYSGRHACLGEGR